MNRPIKFRAWDKLAKVMLPVQTIDFVNEKLTTGSADAANKSDTPENAACKLAIELFKQGVLK